MTFDLAEYEARLEPWSDIQGHMPFLRETAERYADPVIIELGTRSGQSTSCFLAAIRDGGHLWSVDVNTPDVPAHWHELPRWHFLRADDVSALARAWLPAQCDILFIDTSHEQEHTLAELRAYAPRVREGGMILLHDTQWVPGDKDLGEPSGPVALALNLYCTETGLLWHNRPGFYGLGVLPR